MANAKRNHDVAFKCEALRLLEMSVKSTREIEAELGISSLKTRFSLGKVRIRG